MAFLEDFELIQISLGEMQSIKLQILLNEIEMEPQYLPQSLDFSPRTSLDILYFLFQPVYTGLDSKLFKKTCIDCIPHFMSCFTVLFFLTACSK